MKAGPLPAEGEGVEGEGRLPSGAEEEGGAAAAALRRLVRGETLAVYRAGVREDACVRDSSACAPLMAGG